MTIHWFSIALGFAAGGGAVYFAPKVLMKIEAAWQAFRK